MNRSHVKCPHWMAKLIKNNAGVVPFSRFMDWALNDPYNGAYGSGKLQIGVKGDFVTSPSLGPEFCDLLAVQIVDWINQLEIKNKKELISIIDVGPGEGHLALYLITALLRIDQKLASKVNFILIDINKGMIKRQRELLSGIRDIEIKWMTINELSDSPVRGIVIAHEILDSLPVDRVVWKNDELFLQGVKLTEQKSSNFIELCELHLSNSIKQYIHEYIDKYNHDFPPKNCPNFWNSELHTSLFPWFKSISSILLEGNLLIIDYAHEFNNYYKIDRNNGTILRFLGQSAYNNFLEMPGDSDITSHLCLESLYQAARQNDWEFLGQRRQGLALLALGLSEKLNLLKNIPNNDLELALNTRENLLRLVDPICLGDFRWVSFKKSEENGKIIHNCKYLNDP